MLKEYINKRKKKIICKKRDRAYMIIVDAVRTSTQPTIQIQLSGDIEMYEPIFEILYDEGYVFTTEYIPGERMSSGIVIVNVETERRKNK